LLCPPIPNDRFNSAIADRKAEINPKDPVLANTTARSDVTPFHALICDARVQPKSRARNLRDGFHAREAPSDSSTSPSGTSGERLCEQASRPTIRPDSRVEARAQALRGAAARARCIAQGDGVVLPKSLVAPRLS